MVTECATVNQKTIGFMLWIVGERFHVRMGITAVA